MLSSDRACKEQLDPPWVSQQEYVFAHMPTQRLPVEWCLCVSLQAIATTLHVTVESITGLPPSALGPAGSPSAAAGNGSSSSGTASPTGSRRAGSAGPRIALVVVDTLTQ
jgi:hypothetical protein